jgi:hypothetical protein
MTDPQASLAAALLAGKSPDPARLFVSSLYHIAEYERLGATWRNVRLCLAIQVINVRGELCARRGTQLRPPGTQLGHPRTPPGAADCQNRQGPPADVRPGL